MNVEWMESRRYLVISLSNPDNVHLADLEEFDGFGECSCEFWPFALGPKLQKGVRPFGLGAICGRRGILSAEL